MDSDFASSVVLVLGALAGVSVFRAEKRAHARIRAYGGSVLLGEGTMQAGYSVLDPIGRWLARHGASANAITLVSLALALVAGGCFAFGHFGVGTLVAAIGMLGDAFDGIVARERKTASAGGALLDSVVDRASEFFVLGGIAFAWRAEAIGLGLVLGALFASFLVSYVSAKAEALRVKGPRGLMRRAERAAYLAFGTWVVPLLAAALSRFEAPPRLAFAPLAIVLLLVFVLGTGSSVHRLVVLARLASDPKDAEHISPSLAPR